MRLTGRNKIFGFMACFSEHPRDRDSYVFWDR